MLGMKDSGRRVEGEIDTQVAYYSASANAKPHCLIPGTLQPHYYAPKTHPHTASACCLIGESGQEMEIKFSFKSKEELQSWYKVFQSMLEDLSQQQQLVLFNTVKSISNYLHDRNTKVETVGAASGEDEDGFEVVDDPTLALVRGMRLALTETAADGTMAESGTAGRSCLSRAVLRSRLRPYWSLPIPRLRILIMTVGTRGDVQPFILLGQRLQRDGHRVRLATHGVFRDFVCKDNGLEFYPLGGDPQWLSQFMVKTKGFLVPMTLETIGQVPKNVAMINEIIHSCWGACIYPDPADPLKRQFIADAIISNPVTYGHVHCAEALGVPLHLMFPQPWVPTKAFPHPLSGMKYGGTSWSAANYLSYQTVDGVMWQSFLPYINNFRVNTLKLEPIRFLEKTWDLLNYHKVPFVKMWSRYLAPKPKDWPSHVDIVGAFVNNNGSNNRNSGIKLTASDGDASDVITTAVAREPKDPLEAFLSLPHTMPPIFVGFGSMVVDKPEQLIKTMLEGAAIADVRILVQSGWSDINQEWFLRTSEAIERRYNKASAYATNWNSVSSAESNNTDKGSIIAPDKASVLSSSILGAIGQPMASSASSSTDSCSSGSGVVRRGLAPFHKDDENDIMSMPAISGIQGTRWRATDALLIGNFPHDKLFPRVSAVVHHGGAGTTAGGLIAGKPTFICPFFGDQNFWGEMVQKSGLGPAPCLVEQLTPQIVAEKFMKLLSADVQSRARKVSVDMKAEGNGVELGALAFYRHLPIENMLCDVSLMRHEVRLAQVFCKTCGLKMARNISDILHSVMCCGASTEETKKGGYEPHRRNSRSKSVSEVASGHDVVPCVYVDWSLPPPGGVVDGVLQGAGALAHETLGAIADAFTDPLKGVYYGGIQGGIQGVYSGLRSLATRPVAGTRVMYDKVSEGMRNTGLTSRSSRSLGNNSGIERTVDERESGGVAPEVQADDADDDLPEQAARWYGENSMLLMSTSAQAKADRSLLFSEEVMGEAYPAVGARSVIQRYGPQGFMESTIIEELDNEDCESIVDESDTVGDSSASMAVAAVTLLQNIITSDRVASPNTAGNEAEYISSVLDQSTTPSISRLLDKLDSTNAAIRRFSETGVFVEIEANSDSVVSIISEEEEVQSVIDIDEEESDTNSIIIETAEGAISFAGGDSYKSTRHGKMVDFSARSKNAITSSMYDGSFISPPNQQRGLSIDQSVVLFDKTLGALQQRTILQCFYMAQNLQKVFSSVSGRNMTSFSAPIMEDFEILVSAAASKNLVELNVDSIKECGKLLHPAYLLHNTIKRGRKRICFTDVILLYLQEELPFSAEEQFEDIFVSGGVSSSYWCHQGESDTEVWAD